MSNFTAIESLKQLREAAAPAEALLQSFRAAADSILSAVPDEEAANRLIAKASQAADWLRDAFKQTAEWRREKASEHPDDERNAEAAVLLDRLATTVEDASISLLLRYHELFSDDDPDVTERQNDRLKEIGFHRWPKDAEDFLTDFLASAS